MAMSLRVVVPPHPLIGHWLTMLRHRETPPALYATAMQELGRWLTYEALRDWLPHRREPIPTAHGDTEGLVVESRAPLLAMPVMPGGLELWQGGRQVLPEASLCLNGVPDSIETNAGLVIFIDQITDGTAVLRLLQDLQQQGVSGNRIRLITALCANPGLKILGEAVPDLTIYTTCIDEALDAYGQAVPGIGDPLQRLNLRWKGRV
ncbi:putative uracil phosphoribosyltransferase [Synechococcus sp. BL107]|uniref:uracil phosphoribosyltransferase n=1 Tax=Synechococcus sp. BL107 TaxID=313625 RepID=UPI0000E54542|nr:uracil phosphoribosyltransferase [Synechococcus sp. BL107]EAU71828.1 putative uracil phosphoribosyltransferase [Synechococcus sp. BL107]